MKLSDTLYENFTSRERLALFYEAMSRKDYAEADRLADTCEHKSYKMQDAAYLQSMQYIHLSCLHALLAISEAESCAAAAGVSMLLTKKKNTKEFRHALCIYAASIRQILGIWEAWQEFCATAEVDPKSVMRTYWGGVPRIVEGYPLIDSDLLKTIKADPEAKAEMLDLFMGQWRVIQSHLVQ